MKNTIRFLELAFNTKYNWGLVVITAIWWFSCFYYPYYDKNFDMSSSMINYIMNLSLVCIAVSLIHKKNYVAKLGVITQIIAVFSLSTIKSVMFNLVGLVGLLPLAMFCFLLLLKSIWIAENE